MRRLDFFSFLNGNFEAKEGGCYQKEKYYLGNNPIIIPSTPNNKYVTLFALKEDG
jgi:hypothetical protein